MLLLCNVWENTPTNLSSFAHEVLAVTSIVIVIKIFLVKHSLVILSLLFSYCVHSHLYKYPAIIAINVTIGETADAADESLS